MARHFKPREDTTVNPAYDSHIIFWLGCMFVILILGIIVTITL